MARLLLRTLHNFNMHEKISTYLTNEACLPKPYTLSTRFVLILKAFFCMPFYLNFKIFYRFYIKLSGIYAIVFLLIYKLSFFTRLRRLICSYFYRKREKQRVLYLYNDLLRKRYASLEVIRKTVESNVVKRKLRRRINIALVLFLMP